MRKPRRFSFGIWVLGPVWSLGARFHPTENFWQDGRLKRPHTWMDYHPTPGQDFAIWYIWHTKYQIANTKYQIHMDGLPLNSWSRKVSQISLISHMDYHMDHTWTHAWTNAWTNAWTTWTSFINGLQLESGSPTAT